MMATAFPEENKFGYICSYQTQATYKYRYGYSEGVLSVNPDAEFMYNYTNSYADTTLAYEYALQQQNYISEIASLVIELPSKERQSIIASLMTSLNSKLDIEAKTKIRYEEQKRYLLSQMFI